MQEQTKVSHHNTKKQDPWQVCSLYLQVNPNKFDQIQETLLGFDNAEIPVSDKQSGKIILLLSSNDQHQLLDNLERSKDIDGVLSVSLVYHQQDDEDLL